VKYGARSATQQERMQRRSNAAVFMKGATESLSSYTVYTVASSFFPFSIASSMVPTM